MPTTRPRNSIPTNQIRSILTFILSGYFFTGLRALVAEHGWDSVVLDIGIPDADGLELISEVPSECGVILVAGFGNPESRLAGREAGADDHEVSG